MSNRPIREGRGRSSGGPKKGRTAAALCPSTTSSSVEFFRGGTARRLKTEKRRTVPLGSTRPDRRPPAVVFSDSPVRFERPFRGRLESTRSVPTDSGRIPSRRVLVRRRWRDTSLRTARPRGARLSRSSDSTYRTALEPSFIYEGFNRISPARLLTISISSALARISPELKGRGAAIKHDPSF